MSEGGNWVPLSITVAPNGAYKTAAEHPALPLTAPALAATASACADAGAAMIHLHVRDAQARHSLDPALYAQAMLAIREQVGPRLLIQVTSEAAGRYQAAEQMAMMREIEADSMSLAIRELVATDADEAAAAEFFARITAAGIAPQYIIYSADELVRYQSLRQRGVIPAQPHLLLWVLGRYNAGQVSAPTDLLPFLLKHDQQAPWAVCAFGPMEHACTLAAASFGGHVRVGFENNLRLRDGRLAPDNAALVRQSVEAAAALGRPLADAAWLARELRGA